MASPGLDNRRFITSPDDASRVWKVRRIEDGKFKQVYSATESNTDADRWGFRYDRIWITEADAVKVAAKEKYRCEAVAFRLVEDK